MNIDKMKKQLLLHEGIKLKPYKCTAGKLTIGIGRNLDDKGISTKEALMLLENDIHECMDDLNVNIFPNKFFNFPEPVQQVLCDMRFQLGSKGFRQFKRTIKSFNEMDYRQAIIQMKDSKWYRQTPNRVNDLINMLELLI